MLVRCFECDNEISSETKICPRCGYKGYYWHTGAGETSAKAQRYPSKELARQGLQEEFSQNQARIRANLGPGSAGSSSGHSSSGSGSGGIGCVIAIIIAVVVFLLFFIALIVGIGGNATGHWGFMLVLLKIVWWPIKTLFVIVWFLVKIPFIIADKITVPGLLLIALAGLVIGAIIVFRRKG